MVIYGDLKQPKAEQGRSMKTKAVMMQGVQGMQGDAVGMQGDVGGCSEDAEGCSGDVKSVAQLDDLCH